MFFKRVLKTSTPKHRLLYIFNLLKPSQYLAEKFNEIINFSFLKYFAQIAIALDIQHMNLIYTHTTQVP